MRGQWPLIERLASGLHIRYGERGLAEEHGAKVGLVPGCPGNLVTKGKDLMNLNRAIALGVSVALGVLSTWNPVSAQGVISPPVFRRPIPTFAPATQPTNAALNPRLPATLYQNINMSYLGGGIASGGQAGQIGQIGQAGQIGQIGQAGQIGQIGQSGQIGQIGQGGQFGQQGGQQGQFGQGGQFGQQGGVGGKFGGGGGGQIGGGGFGQVGGGGQFGSRYGI